MNYTLQALQSFPQQLRFHYEAIPVAFKHWAPRSWDGVPSEALTAIEQVCHVRDIEIEGYQVRFRRTLAEERPKLDAIDTERLARERNYGGTDFEVAFAAFRAAREETLSLLKGLSESDFKRSAVFEGYGEVTVRSLVHYLCSHDQQHLSGLQWLMGKIESQR
jgi:hypothetical protein